MSNLHEYKQVVDSKLYDKIFLNDRKLSDSNLYVSNDFSGTIQQLFILRNWEELNKKISQDELWVMLKLYDHRPAKLIFNTINGKLVADSRAQELYKKFYYNSMWLYKPEDKDIRNYFNISTLVLVIVLLVILYFVTGFIETAIQKVNYNLLDPLKLLEISTRYQQWK